MRFAESKGFTLIELLLVILIIIGLAAIVVPNYMNVSDESNDAVNYANYEALKAASRLLVLDAGLSNLAGGTPFSGNLNVATGSTTLSAAYHGTNFPHAPYIEVADLPVDTTGGTPFTVTINKTSGAFSISPGPPNF